MLIYDSAVSEARILHGRNEGCQDRSSDALYFSIFRKTGGRPSQRSYRMPRLDDVVQATVGQHDVYLSQSSFGAANRRASSFEQTRSAWVDLDIYNIDRVLDVGMVNQILAHGQALGIPTPTAIISSGRGCYLKWAFKVPVSRAQLPVWNSLQATLFAAYASLAADHKARDASRVFRLIESVNSKSGAAVEQVEGCGQAYDFGAFCIAVEALRVDLLAETTKDRVNNLTRKKAELSKGVHDLRNAGLRGDAAALALYADLNEPIMMKGFTARSLNWARFCDLKDLYAARGGIPVGQRDLAMFWMLNFLSHSGVVRASQWNQEMTSLLKAFPSRATFDPLADGSMASLLKRARHNEAGFKYIWRGQEVSPLYRPSNQHLIEAFEIEQGEMSKLSTIIDATQKRNRQDVKAPGRQERREARVTWRKEVLDVFVGQQSALQRQELPEPINMTALAKYVGTDRSALSRYWSELKRSNGKLLTACEKKRIRQESVGRHALLAGTPLKAKQTYDEMKVALELSSAAALAAEHAASQLLSLKIEAQLQRAQETWARRKLSVLIKQPNLKDETMPVTPELAKRLQLLNTAKAAVGGGTTPKRLAPQPLLSPSMVVVKDESVVAVAVALAEVALGSEPSQPLVLPERPSGSGSLIASGAALSASERLSRLATRRSSGGSPESIGPPMAEAMTEKALPLAPLFVGGPNAPGGFPDKAAWPSDVVAPGSRYTQAAWDAAAQPDADSATGYAVIEFQSATSSWLMQFMKPERIEINTVINGAVVKNSKLKYPENFKEKFTNPVMGQLVNQLFDRCVFVNDQAACDFPSAVDETSFFGGVHYRVLRPRSNYLNEQYFFSLRARIDAPLAEGELDWMLRRHEAKLLAGGGVEAPTGPEHEQEKIDGVGAEAPSC